MSTTSNRYLWMTRCAGRDNVVHTPHIAGRTKDANLRVADMTVDDFACVLNGEKPLGALTPQAAAVRTQNLELPF